MEQVIAFAPSEAAGWLLGLCAAVVTVSAAATAVVQWVRAAKKPEADQDSRIAALEQRAARHDELFLNDKRRLESIENGNRVTQRAILALLDHGLDGNNTEQMRQAKDDLQRHLIER